MPWFRWVCRGLLAVVLLAADAAAGPLSRYERDSLDFALREVDGRIDPRPDGKWVEAVDVVSLDVIEPRDPAPAFLNWLHATTRDFVVRREVLLKVGTRFDPRLALETERNLRFRQLSVVLVVALRGSSDDRVRILVVVKDVWSLRVNWEPTFVNGRLSSLYLQPSEENLIGRHKTVNANVTLLPKTYELGLGFVDPRIAGSRLRAAGTANLVFDCDTDRVVGSNGAFAYGKPLYSTRTRWAWMTTMRWNEGPVRPRGTVGQSICGGQRAVGLDFASTREREDVPYEYRRSVLAGEVSATRSYGIDVKRVLNFGFEAQRLAYRSPDLSAEAPEVRSQFQHLMPVADTRISPFVQFHEFENRYVRALDLETLGLQEDHRLGHELWLRAYPAARFAGSTRDLVGLHAGLGYTVRLADGLARAFAQGTVEIARRDRSDTEVLGGARIVSPRTPLGRLVLDGRVVDRLQNYLNPTYSIGGTTRLRGYRTAAFVGPNVIVGNVELRSRAFEVLSVQVGAVAFLDVGDAFRSFSDVALKKGTGVGLRVLLPQLDRTVFRVDLGIPLNPSVPAAETSIIAQFGQAFDMPELRSPSLVQ